MEYYSLMKRNELLSHKRTSMNLTSKLLSERRQSEKATELMISTRWHSGKDKILEIGKRLVIARGLRVRGSGG